ncbi:H(+)/Cl(-) exchange transporter ClcA [Sideroxyarcus emersonii]|uniref:H(+)/Cl(-) exchange transporter ClcA n=1 Tax=Sideroxyarcus emersonii TaxID=2764705 RepID=A0AAN2BYQ9_9PROT|nr:H(+)/Cl(-) exchange transporter ClcA [Sideroxyarcus emersonii]
MVFWIGACAVGVVSILFALASNQAQALFRKTVSISPLLPLIVTPIGFAAVVYLTRRFFPAAQGSGIPQTIAALETPSAGLRGAMLSLRIAVAKIFLTIMGLLSGASIGREGPTVQIGASIMHNLGRFAHYSRNELDKGLILAGGAAGIAAAFNTPLAGIVFAIEELSRAFEQRTSGTILIAVILAGIVSLAMLGNYAYFGHTSVTLALNGEWAAVVACGLAGGLLGGAFSRLLILSSRGLPGRAGVLMQERPVVFAMLCGLLLAMLGIASGSTIYGTGYDEARGILEGTRATEGFGFYKMLATIVSYLSGIPGGIFAPSLAVGSGFGASLATVMPGVPMQAMVILGMVAYFSGVVQTPITAFVIVMEMTDDHNMLLPLMATSFIAFGVSRIVCPVSLYQALAQRFLSGKSAEEPAKSGMS